MNSKKLNILSTYVDKCDDISNSKNLTDAEKRQQIKDAHAESNRDLKKNGFAENPMLHGTIA